MDVLRLIFKVHGGRAISTVLFVLLFTLIYYGSLMLGLVVTFDDMPNYVNFYDWFGNVAEIFRATPSFSDAMKIASEEWLLEIGFMNYDFGHGISEWSLTIIPLKMVLVMLLAFLLITNWRLYRYASQNRFCETSPAKRRLAGASSGFGALLVGAGSMTMFWVVCCASPSWVVGLAMLGWVSTSAALTLDPYENLVLGIGFTFMLIAMILLAFQIRRALIDNENANLNFGDMNNA